MRVSTFLKSALLVSGFSLVLGCQKERAINANQEQSIATAANKASQKPVTRAYRDSFDYQLSFYPDIPGGWTPADVDAPAWYPGTGIGNATHIGKANIFLNGYTLRINGIVTVFHAPVNLYFDSLAQVFNVPENVSAVVYDENKANAIWFRVAPEGMPSRHLSATLIAMDGKVLIVGGTGKFAGATGETIFHAVFDQASYNKKTNLFTDATVWQSGWIRY